jgi:hypothetical protein
MACTIYALYLLYIILRSKSTPAGSQTAHLGAFEAIAGTVLGQESKYGRTFPVLKKKQK